MTASDNSQTTPVQIKHVLFLLCCSTQIGHVEQHKIQISVVCTGVVWVSSPAVPSVFGANEAICKLTAWNIHKRYKKHKLAQKE